MTHLIGWCSQSVLGPAGVDERADLGRHLDLGRPLARALLRKLVCRVDAELAADELRPGCVVEVVERTFAQQDVTLGVDVCGDAEEDLVVVVDVHPLVDDDHALRQAEQAETPDGVHDLLCLAGEGLADRDDRAVVERAGDRQVVVDDLRHGHPHGRQEDPLGRLAEPGVLGRRLPDDDRRIDRVATHRHRRDVEDGKRLGRRVVAGVVAEGALDSLVARLDVALEDDLGVGRHLEVDGLRLDELDGIAAQKTGEHQLVDVLRQGR